MDNKLHKTIYQPIYLLIVVSISGLDPGQYKSRAPVEDHEDPEQREEDRFLSCSPLLLSCVCGEEVRLDAPFRGGGKTIAPALLVCPAAKPCGGYPLQVLYQPNYSKGCRKILKPVFPDPDPY